MAGVHKRGSVSAWRDLTQRGVGVRRIGKAVGVSASTAWRWRQRFGGAALPSAEPSFLPGAPTVIDLFSGAGGMSAGFVAAGYRVVAAVESWQPAASSFQAAHPAAVVIVAPIEAVSGRRLLRAAGLVKGECAVLVGGPPCPPFSTLSASRLTDDARHHLWRDYMRIVGDVLPRWAVVENVSGLLSSSEAMAGIRDAFAALGYSLDCRVLDAVDFGVAQHRRRAVIIARRDGGPIPFPTSSHGPGRLPYRTAADALEPSMDGLTATEIPPLSALATERLSYIAAGESVWDAMPRLPHHLRIRGNGFPSSIYRRLVADHPSYTVTGSGGGGTLGYHWQEDRPLSNRERARLQGFADGHDFIGSDREVRAQIGNAVPPPLARAVATALRLIGGGASLNGLGR